jgi:activator of HSP90 ATPase
MELEWEGVAQDGTKVEGKLSIPEVSHEITLDGLSDYQVCKTTHPVPTPLTRHNSQFSWKLTTASSPTVDALFKLAKTRLPTALETKFAEFPSAIIETHGKDLQVAGSGDPSRSGTPVQPATPASASGSQRQPASVKSGANVKPVNTTAVTVEANFMASAEDLFSLLTDENRIPSWTRAPAKVLTPHSFPSLSQLTS